MITIYGNKTTKKLKQLAAELRHWEEQHCLAQLGSEEEYEASEKWYAIHRELSNLATCKDCKYCTPSALKYKKMYCLKLRGALYDMKICDDGHFKPKSRKPTFQMF